MAGRGKGGALPPKGPSVSPDKAVIGGSRQLTTGARDAKAYLWSGTIIHVDTETMVCSIQLDSGEGERHDVPIPAPGGAGPRSWSGSIPEPGTRVVLDWKKFDNRGTFTPYIVAFLTPGTFSAREYEPFSTVSPEDRDAALRSMPELADDPHLRMGTTRLKLRKGYSGDYVASSSSGSDFILDRDVYFTNRAGSEFRLRDADQTAILQVRNEFTSNAAGSYYRGLVKRNAFNLLPDLYPLDDSGVPVNIISPGVSKEKDFAGDPIDRHPAYNTLLQFGLIKSDGTRNFVDDPNDPLYPYVVHPDGQRTSYVVHGEHNLSFNDTPFSYIEDRRELHHLSDGIQKVTEEGDGFQIDPPFPVYIEDVWGTVVGNDPHSDAGRPLYKRVLGMRVFSSPEQKSLSDGPIFEPIDTVTRLALADDLGLARLVRIQSPNSSNQYCFGITKEGKVLLHVPKTRVGEPHEKGKSVDLNIAGLVKAVIGSDENSENMSVDLRMLGGMNLEVGRFGTGESIRLHLHGGITKHHHGDPQTGIAEHNVVGGSILNNVSGSVVDMVGGNIVSNAGAENSVTGQKVTLSAGPGGMSQTVGGDLAQTVLGKTQQQFAEVHQSAFALGRVTKVLLGTDSTTVLVGSISRTVVAGAGITDTVTAGNIAVSTIAGNLTLTVATGTFSATVGAGAMSFTAGGGPLSLTSGALATVTAPMFMATAPFCKIGATGVGFAVAGIPGPPAPHLDYITGLPILGVPTVLIG